MYLDKENEYPEAKLNPWLQERFKLVDQKRNNSGRKTTKELAKYPYRFGEVRQTGNERCIVIPRCSSESKLSSRWSC